MSRLLRPFRAPGTPPARQWACGEGVYLTDISGQRFLDAASGLWNINLGSGNRRILDQMKNQLDKLAYGNIWGNTHAPAEALADKLIELSNGRMSHVYLSTSGTSAVEVAMRIAQAHFAARGQPEKKTILSFDRGYHGCSAMNLSASGSMHGGFKNILPGFQTIRSPDNEAESLSALETVLKRDGKAICALLAEPVLGSAGVIVPSADFWRHAQEMCRAHDILLIADEVATGGGRCGSFFVSDQLLLEPDIQTLSKGINAGYFPLGATLFRAPVITPISEKGGAVWFGSTQDGNPVGCAAALATIDVLENEDIYADVRRKGILLRDALAELIGRSDIAEIRGMGLMVGMELRHTETTGALYAQDEALKICTACEESGLLIYHFANGISLFPALVISDAELEQVVDTLAAVLLKDRPK